MQFLLDMLKNAYRILSIKDNSISESRDAEFLECVFFEVFERRKCILDMSSYVHSAGSNLIFSFP